MAVRDYEPGVAGVDFICRDNIVNGPDNVYAGNMGQGQGCCTVWYNSVPACRAMLRLKGKAPSGFDFKVCGACKGHYSVHDDRYKIAKDYACKKLKERITVEADELLEKYPILGKKTVDEKAVKKLVEKINKEMLK